MATLVYQKRSPIPVRCAKKTEKICIPVFVAPGTPTAHRAVVIATQLSLSTLKQEVSVK
jgi:hypothetical protein